MVYAGIRIRPGRAEGRRRRRRHGERAHPARREAGTCLHAGAGAAPGFGPAPAFSVLLAERGAELVGSIMFHDAYNSDVAARGVWVVDLFVLRRPSSCAGSGDQLPAPPAAHH